MNASAFVDIDHRGRRLRIEHVWIDQASTAPLLLFLHEGLGSVAMWRDFPARLCAATGCRGLLYSRPGYGRSTPRAPDERWGPDFLEIQAREVLPAFLAAVGVDPARAPLLLFGHSDGASIALIHAAHAAASLAGIIVLAPHILVEPISLASIERARIAYAGGDFRSRLARFHDDVDSAFHGWNRAWLDPRFRDWSIEATLGAITCPVLAIQGEGDEYGSFAQIDGIAARAPDCRLLELADCGHSPHRDQPDAVIAAVIAAVSKWLSARPAQASIRS